MVGFVLANMSTIGPLMYSELERLKVLYCVSRGYMLVESSGARKRLLSSFYASHKGDRREREDMGLKAVSVVSSLIDEESKGKESAYVQ